MTHRGWIGLAFCCLVAAAACDRTAAAWATGVNGVVRDVAQVVTSLGRSGSMFLTSACLAVAGKWVARTARDERVRDRMRRLSANACYVFAAVAGSGLAAQALKHAVGRVRPNHVPGLGPFSFHPFSTANAFASFPSGHTTSAFAAATALGLVYPRTRPAVLALAVAIGVSRVALMEHYPSDVVAGAALGTTMALALAPARRVLTLDRVTQAWREDLPGLGRLPAGFGQLDRPSAVTSVGNVFRRRGAWLPAVLTGGFAVVTPPSDLFGSEVVEHVKDGAAILVALAGLTVRGLVAGFGQDPRARTGSSSGAPGPETGGAFSLCRNPLRTANTLVFSGIFLMHGNPWTVALGTATYILIHAAVVRAEEREYEEAFASAYRDYMCRVPRWIPDLARLKQRPDRTSLNLRRALASEYLVVGATVVALALAEFYEELREPLVGSRVTYVEGLASVILGVSAGVGAVWLAKTHPRAFRT